MATVQKLYNKTEAAEYVRSKGRPCSVKNIRYHYYESGYLQGQKVGRDIVFTQAQLDAFIKDAPRHNAPGRKRTPAWRVIADEGAKGWQTVKPGIAFRVYLRQKTATGERQYFADFNRYGKKTRGISLHLAKFGRAASEQLARELLDMPEALKD